MKPRLTRLTKRYKYLLFVLLMLGTACTIFISGLEFATIVALIVFLCAISADFLSTYLGLKVGGREGNPVIAFLFKKLTVGGTFALMGVLWTAFILWRFLPSNAGSQTAIALTYWLVPVNNFVVLKRLQRKQCRQEA